MNTSFDFPPDAAAAPAGPVTCLGLTFPDDAARRAHFTQLLRDKLRDPQFRAAEGFPLADDEATRRRFDDAHEALWRKLDDISETSASGDDATASHNRPAQPTRRR